MQRHERPLVSRVRGAACNGINHAGESPVAAIARFGCVAVPDVDGGRPSTAQAQVKVLGAEANGPIRQEGERNLGPQRERTLCEASKWLPTRNGSWGIEQPSSSRKGEGRMRPRAMCGRAALKPYWGKPAVRNFRGATGNGSYGRCYTGTKLETADTAKQRPPSHRACRLLNKSARTV
jgi:hypothetical protein